MSTLNYYEINGKAFAESTVNVDMSDTYNRFLPLVKKNGRILDLGCGSGRDSLAFKTLGFEVVAVDGSKELCQFASELLNQEVINKRFDEIDFDNEFDGIWACASLLHVSKNDMHSVLTKVSTALKEDGIFYCSYKYGEAEREKEGRSFSDYTENDQDILFTPDLHLEVVEWWISQDVRKDRQTERWINYVLKKHSVK